MTQRANEEQFNELHGLVTNELIGRIKSGTATTQDIKAAADWLAKNIHQISYNYFPLL